jgi:uncharacterized membrane protein YgdD (TMEM256/DUF423 family)
MSARGLLVAGCVSAFLGVAAGAFGAHGLQGHLPADLLQVYDTGVRYQLLHALALVALAAVAGRWAAGGWGIVGWLFVAGTVLFSGSLYALALTGVRWLGAVTPFGGVAFLAGWAIAALTGWRSLA